MSYELGLFQNKNYIINGNFDFWQRGTTSAAVSGYVTADRWTSRASGDTINEESRQSFTLGQTDVPNESSYYHRTVWTYSSGAGNLTYKNHRIESVKTLAGKIITLSFYAKTDSSKNIAVEFSQAFGTGGSPSTAITGIGVTTCALTTSWKKFTVTTTLPSISGKTLGSNNDDYINLLIWLSAGSTFNARTNSLGQQSGTVDIAQVKLEEGSVATPFCLAGGTIAGELVACQRYYEKNYNIDTVPGTSTTTGNEFTRGNAYAYQSYVINYSPKRTNPTITQYGSAGTTATWRNTTSNIDVPVLSFDIGNSRARCYINNSAQTLQEALQFYWTASAEL